MSLTQKFTLKVSQILSTVSYKTAHIKGHNIRNLNYVSTKCKWMQYMLSKYD